MVWPVDLAPLYPYPERISILDVQYMGAAILVIVITIFCIWRWKWQKIWASVWAYYVVSLFLVLGIIKIGGQAAADRYTYLSSLGPFFLFGIGIAKIKLKHVYFLNRVKFSVYSLIVASLACIIILLSNMTVKQGRAWKDSVTLWSTEIRIYPERSYKAYFNRGRAYSDRGDHVMAVEDFNKSLSINPQQSLVYYNRGTIFDKLGDYNNAIEDFNRASELDPEFDGVYYNRGKVFEQIGEYAKALKDFHTAIEIDPRFEKAYYNLGVLYDYRFRNYQKAVWYYSKAIELNPQNARAHNNRGIVFATLNNYHRAIEDFNFAITLHDKDAAAYYNRGLAYRMLEMEAQAIMDFQKAAQLGSKQARESLQSRKLGW
jgi:tetratricopeptide (TPR) repeat protein